MMHTPTRDPGPWGGLRRRGRVGGWRAAAVEARKQLTAGRSADRKVAPFMALSRLRTEDRQWHDSEPDGLGSGAGGAGLRRERVRSVEAPGALL